MRSVIVALTFAGLLMGCSPANDLPAVEAEIAGFHKQLNAGDFGSIYAQSSPDMKRATALPQFIAFLAGVHRKLGGFQSGAQSGWNDNVTTNGHFVVVGYSAKFDRGDATETFTYRIDGDHAQLVGYNVNSAALIMN